MAGEDRRPSTVLSSNPFIEVTDTSVVPDVVKKPKAAGKSNENLASPSDEFLRWKPLSPKLGRYRNNSESQYADTEVEELMTMLRETESLEEQGDILQYLVNI